MDFSGHESAAGRLPAGLRQRQESDDPRCAITHRFQSFRRWRISGAGRTGRCHHRFGICPNISRATGQRLLWLDAHQPNRSKVLCCPHARRDKFDELLRSSAPAAIRPGAWVLYDKLFRDTDQRLACRRHPLHAEWRPPHSHQWHRLHQSRRHHEPDATPSPIITHTYIFTADVVQQSPDGAAPAGWPTTWGNNVVDYGMDPEIVTNADWAAALTNSLKAIPTISLVLPPDALFHSSTGIYANPDMDGLDWERMTSVELLNPAGNQSQQFQINAGLRIRGGSSRSLDNPKHSFRVILR